MVSKLRLINRAGRLAPSDVKAVEKAIRMQLDLSVESDSGN